MVNLMDEVEFREKYDKPENKFALIEVLVPAKRVTYEGEVDKSDRKTDFVKRRAQLIILPDNTVRLRFV